LCPPWWQGPRTYIETNGEKTTKRYQELTANTHDHLHVYPDGSGINGQVGAAALSLATGIIIKVYMGDNTTSIVYAAEL
ncbi:hypothetical protein BKA61DRAFT_435907, partial [Leptodontidium sp. MPI-SDFR-AT-0119]